jgi:DNA-binding GntR family transcriptional regulator
MARLNDVAQHIREDIVSGEIPFGSRLTIDQLAMRYETSHMPVREALKELAGEGLIVTEPNRGARVRAIDADFVSSLMDLRAGVEAHLARRAAERARPEQIKPLREIEERLEASIAAADYTEALRCNREFHITINEIASTPDGVTIVNRHWLLLAALWRQHGYGADRFAGVASDHQHLITALETNDAQAAEMIMGAHVMKSKQIIIRQIAAGTARKTG